MKYSFVFVIYIFCVLSISCNSNKAVMELPNDKPLFSLQKSACFGSCPVFELKIDGKGYATFYGKRNTDKLGLWSKNIPKEQMAKLQKQFKESNFSKYPLEFSSNIQDLPLVSVGYKTEKGMKVVSGKEDRPESLMQLQFLLEKIADSHDWTQIKDLGEMDHSKEAEIAFIYDQIIIEPAPGLQIPIWLEENKIYGTRLIKKIAPGLNYYLITYNTNLIAPKDYLKLLEDDIRINTAEFNKKTSSRDDK